jgi:hypothetical protein
MQNIAGRPEEDVLNPALYKPVARLISAPFVALLLIVSFGLSAISLWFVGEREFGDSTGSNTPTIAIDQSASLSLEYLRSIMDQYHNRFPIYEDASSAGNHFHSWAKIPNAGANVYLNVSSTNNPHSEATAIRCEFTAIGNNFGGFYFQNGVLPSRDLQGTTGLTFWARGEHGGEKINFFIGGIDRHQATAQRIEDCLDSLSSIKSFVTLTNQWTQYNIDIRGRDLTYVVGGFGWVASASNNPNGAVFYLDDIEYELSSKGCEKRLNEPRFLASSIILPAQQYPFDRNKDVDTELASRNIAFTYDNALALLAFLAEGSEDSLRRARLIGDAFVYASQHDRSYDDGRLRNAYAAGDVSVPTGWTPDGRVESVPIPDFHDEGPPPRFTEIKHDAIDTGDNAWAMISLLALYRRTQQPSYLDTARSIGNFIRTMRNDRGRYQGFLAGINDPESGSPGQRPYASTEHNIDVYAAFTSMYQITGELQWQADAEHARLFVEDMWDGVRLCYLTGTTDPNNRNPGPNQLPLDTQAWAVLAVPNVLRLHPQLLDYAEPTHKSLHDGFTGFDFNADKDGVWFEGTSQMAVAYAVARQPIVAENLQQELRRAQESLLLGNYHGSSIADQDGDALRSADKWHRRFSIGAAAWNVFAQLGFNPYYQTLIPPGD